MITEQEIEAFARLSKLVLTEEEKKSFVKEMSDIVEFADIVKRNLSCEETDMESEQIADFDDLREDEVKPSYLNEDVLQNGESENGYFLVRRNSTK